MKQVTRLFLFLGPGEGGEDDGFVTDFQLDRRREKATWGPDRGIPEKGKGVFSQLSGQILETGLQLQPDVPVRIVFPETAETVAVMIAVPTPTPVATPVVLTTVATARFDEDQVTSVVIS